MIMLVLSALQSVKVLHISITLKSYISPCLPDISLFTRRRRAFIVVYRVKKTGNGTSACLYEGRSAFVVSCCGVHSRIRMPSLSTDCCSSLERLKALIAERGRIETGPTLASPQDIQNALTQLPDQLPAVGLGTDGSLNFVERVILPALAPGHAGPRCV